MPNREKNKLQQSLKTRHVMMIAIGGAIGTGLFLGSGSAIKSSGPSIILSYLIVGIITFFMMRALGELILSAPDNTSFITAVKKYLGDRVEFVVGWTYWMCWLSLAMADLTATGIYLKYWLPSLPQWVGPLVIILILLIINRLNVGLFGELESWFSMIKVVAIIALIIAGAVMIVFQMHIGSYTASLTNIVSHGGFFPRGMHGFLMSFQMVVFAFVGIEIVGLTAGETADPEKDLPKAINSLPIRIGLFYIGSIIAIMAVQPWNEIKATSSPFVQVFGAIGIPAAAGVLNFVVLTAAMSATNSAIFSTSRSLYALSKSGNAPAKLGKVSSNGVPKYALTFSSLILFIIVILNYLMPSKIFDIISTVSTINFIMVWLIIICCHLKYRQNNKNNLNVFQMPGAPWTDWLTIIFYLAILVILFVIPGTRIPVLISLLFILCLWLGYGFLSKNKRKIR
ncbi:AAT family amino acid transporter [Lactobacillus colini]|uniref:AAT family amino acid transporter n=1 Tax=Lactobacillus colini TaxID=1819254 RepID=A0ABS4MDL2_9LACO|nr:amino acid permease [Lactobacillus colini]MBP2057467.1 AAT family amino acid transporter [Lactobacillus colini]